VKYGERYQTLAAHPKNATMNTNPKMLALAMVFVAGWKI
jgi:hypothetical protein